MNTVGDLTEQISSLELRTDRLQADGIGKVFVTAFDFLVTFNSEKSVANLTGEFTHESNGMKGGQISGSVHGTEVSFVQDGAPPFYYKLKSESPNRMKGTARNAIGDCDFTATKR